MFCAATQSIEVVLSAAGTTCFCSCGWVDTDGSTTYTPGSTTIASNGATAVTVMAAPTGTNKRQVLGLTVYNGDTVSHTVTVQRNDNSTVRGIVKQVLAPGQTLQYARGVFSVLSGGSGAWIKSTVLTTASANHTVSAATRAIFLRGVGGGGAGGGNTSVASSAAAAGGGGAGAYLEKTVAVTPNADYAYTCGAAGVGASGAPGGSGGNSTFIVGGTTYTAGGGVGAPVATATTALTAYLGGAGGTATNGDLNVAGDPGQPGYLLIVSGSVGASGCGGSSYFGGGAAGIKAAGNGNTAPAGYGGGGSGSLTAASAARTGGNGTAGCWVVDEYS